MVAAPSPAVIVHPHVLAMLDQIFSRIAADGTLAPDLVAARS
jgi:hypothetical protein